MSRNWFLLLLDKKTLVQAATKKKSPPEKIMKKQPWGDLFCCVLWFPRTFIFPNQKKTPLPSSFLLDPTGNSLQFRRLRLPTRPNRASSITDCFGGGREGGRGTVFPKDFGVSEIPFRPWVGLGFLIAWPRLTFRFIPFFLFSCAKQREVSVGEWRAPVVAGQPFHCGFFFGTSESHTFGQGICRYFALFLQKLSRTRAKEAFFFLTPTT